MAVRVTLNDDGAVDFATPETLFAVNIAGGARAGAQSHQYDVSSDGERFLINTVVGSADAPIKLILNWQPSRTTP